MFCVNLVDDDHAVEIAFLGPIQHAAGHELNAGGGVHHNGGCFNSVESTQGLTDEIWVSRSVDHVHTNFLSVFVVCFEVRTGCTQRVLNRFFERVGVADGCAAFDRTACNDHACFGKNSFCQGGFSATAMADQGNCSEIFG